MSKYKGKYDKCRTCKHIIGLLHCHCYVSNNCPNKQKIYGVWMVEKSDCQSCDKWEAKNE